MSIEIFVSELDFLIERLENPLIIIGDGIVSFPIVLVITILCIGYVRLTLVVFLITLELSLSVCISSDRTITSIVVGNIVRLGVVKTQGEVFSHVVIGGLV